MRTVSFSEPQVQSLLNNHFVCTFSNTQGDPTAGMSIKHSPNEPAGQCIRGNGEQNVQTIFLTPDEQIFHVATGFLSPADLAQEIKFAGQIFGEMQKNPDQSKAIVADLHRSRLKQAGYSDSQIDDSSPMADFNMFFGRPANGNMPTAVDATNGFRSPMLRGMQAFVDRQVFKDNKFLVQNPLLSRAALERDPGMLVGRGKTFFSSSSNSTNHSPLGRPGAVPRLRNAR